MAVQPSSSMARRVALGAAAVAAAALTGCVAVPMDAYDTGAPVVYSDAPYYGSTYYGGPAYYGAPVYAPYWGPSIGIYGGFGDRDRWRRPDRDRWDHPRRPDGGGQWNRPRVPSPGHVVPPPRRPDAGVWNAPRRPDMNSERVPMRPDNRAPIGGMGTARP